MLQKLIKTNQSRSTVAVFSNQKIVREIQKKVEKLGLNMEMLYRAANLKHQKSISVEEFRIFLQRLKIHLKHSQIQRFLYLLDEDFTGEITEDQYIETLVSFSVNIENWTLEKAKIMKQNNLKKFVTAIQNQKCNLKIIFDRSVISYKEFTDFVDNSLEEVFSEKQKFILIQNFDRKNLGYIEKKNFFKDFDQNQKKMEFQELEETADHFAPTVYQQQAEDIKRDEKYVSSLFINKFQKYNKTMKTFTDILALHLQSQKEIFDCSHNSISLQHLKDFLENNFLIVLGNDLIESFIQNLYQRNTRFISNADKKKLKSQNKLKKVKVDIIELKNKLTTLSYCNEDTSKLLFVIRAIKLDEEQMNINEYFKSLGCDVRKKIDFPEFFILAQKVIAANFKEISILQQKYDRLREGYFSLQGLIDDIEQFRVNSNSSKKQPVSSNLSNLKRKMKKLNRNLIEDFTLALIQKNPQLSMNFTPHEVSDIFQKITNQKLNQEETDTLETYIDINRNSELELFELIDFVASHFGSKKDIEQIYSKCIGSYLDSKNITTRNFFKDYGLYDNMELSKFNFINRMNVILGIVEAHADIFYSSLKNPNNKVLFKSFVELIEKNRELKSDEIPVRQPSVIELISKSSIDDPPVKVIKKSNQKLVSLEEIEEDHKKELKEVFGVIGNSLQNIIQKYKTEMQTLNHIIMEEGKPLNILQLKKHFKTIFQNKETYLLINYFKNCDANKNGWIDKEEWVKFSSQVGVHQPKKWIKKKKKVFLNNEQFFKFLQNFAESEEDLILDRETIFEISELENSNVSVVLLKRFLRRKFPKQDITDLLSMLTYLDNLHNGFINFNQFKFLIILISNYKIQNDFDFEPFKQKCITIDQIMENSKVKHAIDIFTLLRNMIQYFTSDEENNLCGFLNQLWKNTGSFVLSIQDFIKIGNFHDQFQNFSQKLEKDIGMVIIMDKWRLLFEYKGDSRYETAIKSFKSLSNEEMQKIDDNFNFSSINKEKQLEIIDCLQFFEWTEQKHIAEGLLRVNVQRRLSQQYLQKSKSIHEDHFHLCTVAYKKLNRCLKKLSKKELKKIISMFFNDKNDISVNFFKFKDILQHICKELREDEILKLFKSIDIDNNHTISRKELKDEILKVKLRMGTEELQFSKSLIEIQNKVKSQLQMTKAESNMTNGLKDFEIKSEHYFQGKKTIFTNLIAALKSACMIVKELQQTSKKYEDPEFGPNSEDIYGQKALYYENPTPGGILPQDVAWLRPEEISQDEKPMFLADGASANDVMQGQLGDCWFIGALSILASDDELIYHHLTDKELSQKEFDDKLVTKMTKGIYPKIFHFLSKFGIYVFQFFKNCQYLYVMIDDRIPCFAGSMNKPQIIYAQCFKRNEFWVELTEKAYAKIHGNYQAIVGGQLDDGLVDMTGRVSEKVKIHTNKNVYDKKNLGTPENFWKRISSDLVNKSMLGCAIAKTSNTRGEGKVYIDGEFIGLMSGHAYGLMDVLDIGKEKLVRIRNPWGSNNPVEWNGAWSDNSPKLIKNLDALNKEIKRKWKNEAEEMFAENKDGAFLMSYDDFLKIWSNLSICKKFSENFEGLRFFYQWTEDESGGTPITGTQEAMKNYGKNPQFIVNVKKKTEVYISLAQEDGRIKSRGKEYFPYPTLHRTLSLCVFNLDKGQKKLEVFRGDKLLNAPFLKLNRDIQLTLTLEKGDYCIVPATKNMGELNLFFLSVYFDCGEENISIVNLRTQEKGNLIAEESENVQKFDSDFKKYLKKVFSKIKK